MRANSILTVMGLVFGIATGFHFQQACRNFAIEGIEDTALLRTTHFSSDSLVNITNLFTSISTTSLPAFCRVELIITTNATARSTALTEVWLPDEWNNRILSFGNGGLAGGVNVQDLGLVAIRQAFAGISTNTGHNSADGDGTWGGPHNDNAIIDWGWRALHMSVLAGKEVVKQYYGHVAKKSYYLGCSTGGRQGLKEVQEFPDDFDGVVVGSPANWQTHNNAWASHMRHMILPTTSPRFISEDIWANVIAPEALRQCDALDGLVDGIINNPQVCNFRPETLTCRPGQDSTTCLTETQVHTVRQVYSDYYEANQTYIFGSYYPGGELFYASQGWIGTTPDTIGLDVFRYFVLNDTSFTERDYNPAVLCIADEVDPGQCNAIKRDLSAFSAPPHNGKIIQYVGWMDQLISPGNSMHYYETVHSFMLERMGIEIESFYRLFMVPGMAHCFDGQGATSFGAALDPNPPLTDDAQHNIIAALVRWVEEGVAPENFTAVNYNGGIAANGVNFTRPFCKYPANLVFRAGDPKSPDSFECMTLA